MKSKPGTYALILEVDTPFEVEVGKLGLLSGKKGYYIYCGSAFGPGGVKARTTHHTKRSQRPHWHIDYLRKVAPIIEIWYSYDPINREHDWTSVLLNSKGISMPFIGFGSSDCSCSSHLLFTTQKPSFHRVVRNIHTQFTDHRTVSRKSAPGN